MPLETTAYAEYKFPVKITFTCAKCGKEACLTEDVFLRTTIGGRISTRDAETLLRNTLPTDAQEQMAHIARQMEKGCLMPYDSGKGMDIRHPLLKLKCPACHALQAANAGGKNLVLRGRSALTKAIIALTFVLILAWGVGMGVVLSRSPVEPMGFLYVTAACIAAGVLLGAVHKAVRKRALREPAFMEKHFGAVLNDGVYADFTPYGLEKVRINSKK